MKMCKRVLSVLCAILLIFDVCAGCLTVYARDYCLSDDAIPDANQMEAMLMSTQESVGESAAAQPETQAETQAETQPQTQAETQQETQPQTQAETQPETQPQTQAETQPETQPQTQAETQPQTQAETQAETQPQTQAETQPETQAAVKELRYDDKDMEVVVTALTEGAIPQGSSLKVVPIEKDNKDTKSRYEDAAAKLQEEAKKADKELSGFMAYDIKLTDSMGNDTEPMGKVRIVMNYKFAAMPEEIDTADAADQEISVLQLEDDENGLVKDITDLDTTRQVENLQTTSLAQVKSVQMTTEESITYSLTWMSDVEEVPEETQTETEAVKETEAETETETETEADTVEETKETETETEKETQAPAQEIPYEDDDVKIIVSAEAGVIPEGVKLEVLPILKDDEATKSQYEDVAAKVEEKIKADDKQLIGFIAYDIKLVDADGAEVEPQGEVKVSMEYKKATIPTEVVEAEVEAVDTEVSVLHLEEDGEGQVKDVVDLGAQNQAEVLTTEQQEVKSVEMTTDGFSVYTLTWTKSSIWGTTKKTVKLKYVDESGNEIKDITDISESWDGKEITLSNEKYAIPIDGYVFDHAEITKEKIVITKIIINNKGNICYYEDDDWETLKNANQLTINMVYTVPKIVNLHYVDENGVEISSEINVPIKKGQIINVLSNQYAKAIDGYEVNYAAINSYDKGAMITDVGLSDQSRMSYRMLDSSTWQNWNPSNNVYNVYIVYQSSCGDGTDIPIQTLGTPEHRKYIKEVTFANDYILSLDVTGKRGQESGVDVLLVLDRSGSMKNNSLLDSLKNVVNDTIVPAILKEGSVNRIAAISFSSKGYTNGDINTGWVTYSDKSTLTSAVSGLTANGGTNWEYAMQKAESILKDNTSNNKKVVIFLSDGAPGYYISSNGEEGVGTPSKDEDKDKARTEAVSYVDGTTALRKASIYSVYLTDDTKTNMEAFAVELSARGIDAQSINGSQNMESAMQALSNQIAAPKYTNVVIEDTLSKYAQLTDNPDYKVVVKDKDGNSEELVENEDYRLTVDDTTISESDNTPTKKITVSLLKELDGDVTYTLSFHVKPTEAAQKEFVKNGGYFQVGDPNTDAEENDTSSEKPGFYTNEKAVLKYKENDGKDEYTLYDRPVLQIDEGTVDIPENPNPIDGSITKIMDTSDPNGYPINLEVKTRFEETSEQAKVDVILIIDKSTSMNDSNRLVNTKTAVTSFTEQFVGPAGTENAKHRIGIVTYGTNAEIKLDFSGNTNDILTSVNSILANGGETNIEAGLLKAIELKGHTVNPTYVILLTDGVPNRYIDESGNNKSGIYNGWYQDLRIYNDTIDTARILDGMVKAFYTIGVVDGMIFPDGTESEDLKLARNLLASKNPYHHQSGYEKTWKIKTDGWNSWTWDKKNDFTYSDGYFEVTQQNAATELQAIWKELATIINNKTAGSTGDGWVVTDQMAEHVKFKAFAGGTINGHTLSVSDDGKTLKANNVTVATFDSTSQTIKWYLKLDLAKTSIEYNKGIDYTYNLTYYVEFEDNGTTSGQKTNNTTYVEPKEDKDNKIYPEKMPFFVNITGIKSDKDTGDSLEGAEFNLYKDAAGKVLIGTATANENGYFSFQIGQSDMTLKSGTGTQQDPEKYEMTVYLKETKAPNGYIIDSARPRPINISADVVYEASTTADEQKGTPHISALALTYPEDSLVSISTDGTMQIHFKNEKREWGIVKRNKNNSSQKLAGAEFGLYKVEDGNVATSASYTGTSGDNGILNQWKNAKSQGVKSWEIPTGTYILKETKAPTGYARSEEEWEITIEEKRVSIKVKDSQPEIAPVDLTQNEMTDLSILSGSYYYFDNVMAYEMPHTGGMGIFLYILGGVLFMMAGALMVYKMKREEVLDR